MSKASEWAMKVLTRPAAFNRDSLNARATDSGEFGLTVQPSTIYMTAENALALAWWIIDTFGETDAR